MDDNNLLIELIRNYFLLYIYLFISTIFLYHLIWLYFLFLLVSNILPISKSQKIFFNYLLFIFLHN